jgi:hypothetical protein
VYLAEHPAWIALALSALGALLAIGSGIVALRGATRLRRRVENLAALPFFDDLAALQYETERLGAAAAQIEGYKMRALAAIETMRGSLRSTGLPQAIAGVRAALNAARGLSRLFG